MPVRPRVLLLGFSRGASMAERFALAHPERVAGVAALSGGAYTLPQPCMEKDGASRDLPMPLGTADLSRWLGHQQDPSDFRQLPFWLSVGADDDRATQLPSAYDASVGTTRVARGETFSRVLRGLGMQTVQFTMYPHTGHTVTPEMVQDATAFLARASDSASAGGG